MRVFECVLVSLQMCFLNLWECMLAWLKRMCEQLKMTCCWGLFGCKSKLHFEDEKRNRKATGLSHPASFTITNLLRDIQAYSKWSQTIPRYLLLNFIYNQVRFNDIKLLLDFLVLTQKQSVLGDLSKKVAAVFSVDFSIQQPKPTSLLLFPQKFPKD